MFPVVLPISLPTETLRHNFNSVIFSNNAWTPAQTRNHTGQEEKLYNKRTFKITPRNLITFRMNASGASRGGGKSSGDLRLPLPGPGPASLATLAGIECFPRGLWSPGAAPVASVDCSQFTSGHYHRSQYRHFIPRVPFIKRSSVLILN